MTALLVGPRADEDTVFDEYDHVLVDAQCTHDSSYRHLRYVGTSDAAAVAVSEEQASVDRGLWVKNECRNYKNINSVESDSSVYALQRQLLAKGFSSLTRGGELVYATCSAEEEQNEAVVEWLLGQEGPRAELVSVTEDWCEGMGSNAYMAGEEGSSDLHRLVELLCQTPAPCLPALSEFMLARHGSSQEAFRRLGDEMCRYAAAFSSPPGREGRLAGTAYFGMWAGTSGLFLSRIRKVDASAETSDETL
jgi:hypothetical protein